MNSRASKTGLLLINLGTPDSPSVPDVRTYLADFLMDPYVIDIPKVFRWLLLHGIILRTRPAKSAAAYQNIWSKETGSPLLYHSLELLKKVRKQMGPSWVVSLGMRYGKPNIESALAEIFRDADVDRLVIVPLYPQYSLAATESSKAKVLEILKNNFSGRNIEPIFIQDFFDHPAFLRAFASQAKAALGDPNSWDHVLLSYHGIPERHVRKTDPTGTHCLKSATCCDQITANNRLCYRAQCFATTRGLVEELGLHPGKYTVGFQSRLKGDPWIRPFTDHIIEEFPKRGVKRLAVLCPSFTADCLETVEEIEFREKDRFFKAGGTEIKLVPSLNSTDEWVNAVCEIVLTAS